MKTTIFVQLRKQIVFSLICLSLSFLSFNPMYGETEKKEKKETRTCKASATFGSDCTASCYEGTLAKCKDGIFSPTCGCEKISIQKKTNPLDLQYQLETLVLLASYMSSLGTETASAVATSMVNVHHEVVNGDDQSYTNAENDYNDKFNLLPQGEKDLLASWMSSNYSSGAGRSAAESQKNQVADSKTMNFSIAPNPATSIVNLNYNIGEESLVTIEVVSLQGLVVETLLSKVQSIGHHALQWNISRNQQITNGQYFVRLTVGGISSTQKLLITK
jgi:hypothetical protein